MALLQLSDACLAYGHVPLLEHANLVIEPGERVCLVGRNGAGKSTLMRVLEGGAALDSGTLNLRDGLRLAWLPQEVPADMDLDLRAVVTQGLGDVQALLAGYHAALDALAQDRPGAAHEVHAIEARITAQDAWSAEHRVSETLARLRLDGHARMGECSGGVRRRALLGRALVSAPDLLLLDEPTNHLDITAIEELEQAVRGFSGTVLFITHDRLFIDRLATRIVELDRGVLRSYPGNYAQYVARKQAQLDAEETQAAQFDRELAAEEVWIRQGIKARRTRNEGRVRRLEAMRRERAARLSRQGDVRMAIAAARQSGRTVLDIDNLGFEVDGRFIVRDFSAVIERGDRIGIVGANGSGKTTLLRLLLGELAPTTGTVRRGTKLDIAYFDQERAQLDPDSRVRDCVADGADHVDINGSRRHVAGYLGDFLFPSSRLHSPVSSLSGGERNRLLLAKLFAQPANVLVLDEPTNDLDAETLDLLEERIGEFDGTLLLVSHDRQFLDNTVTSLFTLAGDGWVTPFPGGYSEWRRYEATLAARSEDRATDKVSPGRSERVSPAVRAVGGKAKLTNKERYELDALPARIEALETRQSALAARTADPGFYREAQTTIESTLRELADVEAELAEVYERWTVLEDRAG
ncbi:MAG: ATP-binding cassette domain-containing protein [Pseudomonadales bacterium]